MAELESVSHRNDRYQVALSSHEVTGILNSLVFALSEVHDWEFHSRFGITRHEALALHNDLSRRWLSFENSVDTFPAVVEQAFGFLTALGFERSTIETSEHGWATVTYRSSCVIMTITQSEWDHAFVTLARVETPDTRVPLAAFAPGGVSPGRMAVNFSGGDARLRALTKLAEETERYAGDALRGSEGAFQEALRQSEDIAPDDGRNWHGPPLY